MVRKTLAASLITSAVALGTNTASAAGEVEVLHWWTSGGEAAALNVLKDDLESKGVTWQDMPVAGGGGTEAMTALRARVTAGNAPTAVQMLGFDILDWAKEGALGNLNAVAGEEGWDDVVPTALQGFGKHDGNWISAPVNVHSTNWVWINKAALDAAGGKAPETWDELVAVLDAMKANGITPLGHGGQAVVEADTGRQLGHGEVGDSQRRHAVDLGVAGGDENAQLRVERQVFGNGHCDFDRRTVAGVPRTQAL